MTLERLVKAAEILLKDFDGPAEITAEHDQIWLWGRTEVTTEEQERLDDLGVWWDANIEGWTAFC